MKAEIISVGTELLLGHLTDTNAPYLAQQLSSLGIDCYWISQNGDNQARMVDLLRRAWQRSDLIVITGGVGPTEDDVTREAIAELMDEEMTVDPELEEHLRDFFTKRNVEMPALNVKQATLIPSASALPNPLGTAPGWWVEKDGHIITASPGVPHEMKRMWEQEIVPRLKQRFKGQIILSKTFKTIGVGESAAEEMVRPLIHSPNPTLATYAKQDGVHLRMTAKANSEEVARGILADFEVKVRAILGNYIYGVDDDTLEGVVGDLLKEQGLTLAVIESCTGGLFSSTITDVAGNGNYFRGGLVALGGDAQISMGLDPETIGRFGVISQEASQALAHLARERFNADVGVAIVGVAGPNQIEGKPIGTVFSSVDKCGEVTTSSRLLAAPRPDLVKRIACLSALSLLRRCLLGISW